jgi:xanthine dehydrogenase YagS FAD-binding subunit
VAAALSLDNSVIQDVRIVLGGVAHKPWPLPDAQSMLIGKPLEAETLKAFAAAAMREAKPQRDNGFKIELCQRAIVRALNLAAAQREANSWT